MIKERSPRFPSDSLPDAVQRTEALYASAGRSPVTSEIAAQAIGYSGLSGASRSTLAAMAYYGLLQREGDNHRVSDLGLRLVRPIHAFDKLEAARIASARPPVFSQIAKEHDACSESVLASILLHKGFTDEGARRAARVYKENVRFLETLRGNVPAEDSAASLLSETEDVGASIAARHEKGVQAGKLLAHYQIPIGSNHAQVTITGERLVEEDFDALADYVRLFKQQFERQSKRGKADEPGP